MPSLRLFLRLFVLVAWIFCAAATATDWPKIPAEEISLKDSPTHPGAHAIILYREENTDDTLSTVRVHIRIKILTEEGRKHANVELPFLRDFYTVRNIDARTVRPDGTSIEFKGQVFDKTVVKSRDVKFLAKTFTLPDVQPGSIIEYKYMEQWDERRFPRRRWNIQEELPTLRAVFARKPYTQMSLRWISFRLPDNQVAKEEKDKWIRLELRNLPPFEEETFMPPREELNMRVDFYYQQRIESEQEFWKNVGKTRYSSAESFIGKHGDIAMEAARVVQPGDPPETKLRKLYARAQQVRNLNYERTRSEKEVKQEKIKDNNNVKDVLRNGYGTGWEINCLFVALARAAGFDASVAYLAGRNAYFFNMTYLDDDQLNAYVAAIRIDGKDLILDPATRYAPYGLLSWSQTGVRGMRVTKDGGDFLESALPGSAFGRVQRKAKLELQDDGTLEGDLEVVYHDQAALSRRLSDYEEDEDGRRKAREDEIKGWLPDGAIITIKEVADFEDGEKPLRVLCTVKIPGFAAATGRRILFPAAVFHGTRSHPFQNSKRVHPIYFHYPFREEDAVSITVPEGFQVEGLPAPRNEQHQAATFRMASRGAGRTIEFERQFSIEGVYFPVNSYPALRSFYDRVRSADEEQIVLRATEAARN